MGALGKFSPILSAETPSTTYKAANSIKVAGNAVALRITTVTGGAGDITFKAQTSHDDTTYYDVVDRNSVAEWVCETPTAAGTYHFPLSGLVLPNGEYVKIFYKAAVAAGTIAIHIVTYVDEGGNNSIEVGDILADLTNLEASNAAIKTAVELIDNAVETDRLAVNPVVGQIGVAAGTGTLGDTVQRVTVATDDSVSTDLTNIKTAVELIDDSVETNRLAVNPVVGQLGVAAGSGVLGDTVQRVTIATNDSVATDLTNIKTAVELIDNAVETDRLAANLIAGQIAITAGAGDVAANTPRMTLAADDPAVVSVAKIPSQGTALMVGSTPVTVATDDVVSTGVVTVAGAVETARMAANLIAGQVAISAGAGAVAANTPRTTLASDDPLVAKVPAQGTALIAASMPVNIASDDPVTVALQALDAAITALSNSLRTEEINPLNEKHLTEVFFLDDEVVLAAGDHYLPTIDGTDIGDYKATSFQLRAVAGQWDDAGTPTDCTLVVKIQATDGLTHGGLVEWFDVGQVVIDNTGAPWVSATSVGTAIARDLIDAGNANYKTFRFHINYDVQPVVATPGSISITMRRRAL